MRLVYVPDFADFPNVKLNTDIQKDPPPGPTFDLAHHLTQK